MRDVCTAGNRAQALLPASPPPAPPARLAALAAAMGQACLRARRPCDIWLVDAS